MAKNGYTQFEKIILKLYVHDTIPQITIRSIK